VSALRGLLAGIFCVVLVGSAESALCSDDIIVLGAAVSLTGKYALNGANTKNGYDLAVRQINDKGGVKIGDTAYKFAINYYDDESTPARGTELVERLIQQDGVKFILGPYGSGLTKAILPIIERHKVPMVEANGAARELFTKGYRYIFAVLSTSDQYLTPAIDLAAEHADKLGKAPGELRVAMVMENDPFAQDVRAGVLADTQRHGMNCVIDDQLPPELNDMSMTLTKVKALKPDLLVVSGHEKGALTAVNQIAALRVDVPVVALMGAATGHNFGGDNMHAAVYGVTKTGAVVDGTIRDLEGIFPLPKQVYYKKPHPAAVSGRATAIVGFPQTLPAACQRPPEEPLQELEVGQHLAVRELGTEQRLEGRGGRRLPGAAGIEEAEDGLVAVFDGIHDDPPGVGAHGCAPGRGEPADTALPRRAGRPAPLG